MNNTSTATVAGSGISAERRSKIIRKPWGRADGIRSAKADRQRAAVVFEFRQQAAHEDAKTVKTIATARDNALTALAFVEARKALRDIRARHGETPRQTDRRRAKVWSGKNLEKILADSRDSRAELQRLEDENKAIDARRIAEIEADYHERVNNGEGRDAGRSDGHGESYAERNA